MTSSNGNFFRLCESNPSVTGALPSLRPMTWSFDVFFDERLNKRLTNCRDGGDLRRHSAHCDITVMRQGPRILCKYHGWWRPSNKKSLAKPLFEPVFERTQLIHWPLGGVVITLKVKFSFSFSQIDFPGKLVSGDCSGMPLMRQYWFR